MYREPEVRGVRWADIMDCIDSGEDVPVRPTVSQPIRSPTPPRRTLRSTIDRRKQCDSTGPASNVYSVLGENVSGVHEPTTH